MIKVMPDSFDYVTSFITAGVKHHIEYGDVQSGRLTTALATSIAVCDMRRICMSPKVVLSLVEVLCICTKAN